MAGSPVLAAGGIVVRHDPSPRIAIVQLRKDKTWVLPKGKLNPRESALAAARREVLEETGHDVSVHEFVGTISYEIGNKSKVVQFWRMQAVGNPRRKLMRDVRAVAWLPLPEAIDKLSHPREQVFLSHVGPVVLRAASIKSRPRVSALPRRKTERTVPAHVEASTDPALLPSQIPALAELDDACAVEFGERLMDEAGAEINVDIGCEHAADAAEQGVPSAEESQDQSPLEPPQETDGTIRPSGDAARIVRRLRLGVQNLLQTLNSTARR